MINVVQPLLIITAGRQRSSFASSLYTPHKYTRRKESSRRFANIALVSRSASRSPVRPFVRMPHCLFVRSFVLSFVRSFVHAFIHLFVFLHFTLIQYTVYLLRMYLSKVFQQMVYLLHPILSGTYILPSL